MLTNMSRPYKIASKTALWHTPSKQVDWRCQTRHIYKRKRGRYFLLTHSLL